MKIRYLMAGTALLLSGLLNAQTPAQALDFDGVDDYIDAPYQSYFPNIKTIELRVRPAVLTTNACIVASREQSMTLFSVHMSNQSIGLWNGVEYQTVNYPFDAGTWYHVTLKFHETSMEVYVNNQFAGVTSNGMSSQQNLVLHIGSPFGEPGGEIFRGAIDDIRFWDHYRTDGEIAADMATTLTGSEPGLLANYTFNQGFEVSKNADEWILMDNAANATHGFLRNFRLIGRNSNWISLQDGLPLNTNAPVINFFSPGSGASGTLVDIFGANFHNDPSFNSVYFGTVKAPVIAATSERLTVEVPQGISPSPIAVTNLQSSLTGIATGAFSSTFASAPIQFNSNENQWINTNPGTIAYGDLDGDGKPEMVTGNEQASGFTVYRNVAQSGTFNSQSFSAPQDFNTNGIITGISLVDMNSDGRLDIVGIFPSTSEAIVILNTTTQPGSVSFDIVPSVSTPYGLNLRKIIAADFNMDGKPDLAVLTHDRVIILPNVSSNSQSVNFDYHDYIEFTGSPADMIVNDLDEDHKADLAIVDATNNNVATIRNLSDNGNFNFSSIVTFAVGNDPFGITASDLNNDGKPELIVSNRGSRTISILENVSAWQDLQFKTPVDLDAPTGTSFITTGDIDGDGRPEIINANDGQNTFTIYKNETPYQLTLLPSSFGSPITLQTSNTAQFPTLVDVDSDGRLDVTILSTYIDWNNDVNYYVNYLHNGLPAPQKPSVYGFSPESAPIGTTVVINADQLPGSPFDTKVLFGSVNATIESMDQYSITVTVPAGATFSQISVINTLTGMAGTSSTHFVPAIGASTISFSSEIKLATSGYAAGLTVADFDNDGKPDLAAGNAQADYASVFTNISTNNQVEFGTELSIPSMDGIRTSAAGDFDGDGKSDLLNAGAEDFARMHFNDGSPMAPAFFREAMPSTTLDSRQLAIADVDGNGWNDFASVDTKYGIINITPNTSSRNQPSFGPMHQIWGAQSPGAIAFADLNNDRKPDLLVTNTADNQVYIFYNYSTPGNINFNLEQQVQLSGTPGKITTGDLNADGTLEIIVAVEGSGTVAIIHRLPYDLSNSFSSTIEFQVGDSPMGIALGDVNGDGKPEIAVTNQADNTISILPNNGANNDISFGNRLVFTVGAAPEEIAIADFNGDGRADIAVTNVDEQNISLLTNTGNFITLPVTLSDFKATKRSIDVLLSWNTASENNSSSFEIEKSSDGQQFVKIGSVAAAGESAVHKAYSFIDQSPNVGTNYYRIKIVDRDGKVTTSAIQVVSFDQTPKVSVKLAPQPMDAIMTVSLSGAPDAASFIMFDMKGQTISNLALKGNATFTIARGKLTAGMYAYKLLNRSGKTLHSGKIIVR